jgi:hypothetical protein
MLKVYTGKFFRSLCIAGNTVPGVKTAVFDVVYQCDPKARLVLRHGRHCVEGICRDSDKLVEQIIGLIRDASFPAR